MTLHSQASLVCHIFMLKLNHRVDKHLGDAQIGFKPSHGDNQSHRAKEILSKHANTEEYNCGRNQTYFITYAELL